MSPARSSLGILLGALVGCASQELPPEPDFVEIASTRAHDAGVDAPETAVHDQRDAAPTWPCPPCPSWGNEPPHRYR